MAKPNLEDFIANGRKDRPFEERAREFEKALEPLSKEWGVAPAAALQYLPGGILATPVLQDLWKSSEESETSGT